MLNVVPNTPHTWLKPAVAHKVEHVMAGVGGGVPNRFNRLNNGDGAGAGTGAGSGICGSI